MLLGKRCLGIFDVLQTFLECRLPSMPNIILLPSLMAAESLLAGGKSNLQSQEVHKAVEDLALSCNIFSKVDLGHLIMV